MRIRSPWTAARPRRLLAVTVSALALLLATIVPAGADLPDDGTRSIAWTDPIWFGLTMTPNQVAEVGTQLTFAFDIYNNTADPITAMTFDLTTFTGSGSMSPITCPESSVATHQWTTCTATYVVTQVDADKGYLGALATAFATVAAGEQVASAPTDAYATIPSARMVVKALAAPTKANIGEVVSYRIAVVNSGTDALGDIHVASARSYVDPPPAPTWVCSAVSKLEPGESMECTTSFTVAPNDINAGMVTLETTATATGPDGRVTAPTLRASAETTEPDAITAEATVSPLGGLVGQSAHLTFGYVLTNHADEPISNVSVNVVRFAGEFADPVPVCPQSGLEPGASMTCWAGYEPGPRDVRSLVNPVVTASGTLPSGAIFTSKEVDAPVFFTTMPAIALDLTDWTRSVSRAGQTVGFTYTITNNLAVPVTPTFTVAGIGDGIMAVSCPTPTAPPAASIVCKSTTRVTQHDLDTKYLGIRVAARATAIMPWGTVIPANPASVTIDVTAREAMTLQTFVSPNESHSVGDELTFTFRFTNVGALSLGNPAFETVTVSGTGALSPIDCPRVLMAPGESADCTATYTVTQADAVAGKVTIDLLGSADIGVGGPGRSNVSGGTVVLVEPSVDQPTPTPTVTPSPTVIATPTPAPSATRKPRPNNVPPRPPWLPNGPHPTPGKWR